MHGYFAHWDWDGTLKCIHQVLYQQCREQAGREVNPTAAVIDSQGVKGAEKGDLHRPAKLPRGQKDQGQEAPHPRRHARLAAARHRACGGDLGPRRRPATLFSLHPFLRKLDADRGHQGPQFQAGVREIIRTINVEIVKRSDAAKGFAVSPKR